MASFIIGLFFGVVLMCILQINNIKDIDMMNFSIMEEGNDLYYVYCSDNLKLAVFL